MLNGWFNGDLPDLKPRAHQRNDRLAASSQIVTTFAPLGLPATLSQSQAEVGDFLKSWIKHWVNKCAGLDLSAEGRAACECLMALGRYRLDGLRLDTAAFVQQLGSQRLERHRLSVGDAKLWIRVACQWSVPDPRSFLKEFQESAGADLDDGFEREEQRCTTRRVHKTGEAGQQLSTPCYPAG